MTLKNTILKYILTPILLCSVFVGESFADGFPVRPGRISLSPSATYFFAKKAWDANSHKGAFDDNGKFTSWSYSLYSEYGISRKFTLSVLAPYVMNNFSSDQGTFKSSGFQDLEVGIRYYLANINYKYYFSIKATAIVPMYNNTILGYNQKGGELKLAFAGSGHLFGKNSFFVLENGVRKYFGSESVFQDRYNATYGLTLDKKFHEQLSLSVGGFYASSINKDFNVNPSASKNFAFNQVSLSYGHSFSKNLSLFLTGGRFITGRNTAVGTNVSASLNYRIDTR